MPFDAISEDFRDTDVMATPWCLAPNSVVQHDSLFRYFEFPFWNRYVGGGVPLFGQGQSMIGDVLHWVPVFLEGSAIGWDIKFVLSKAIFAVGMGLLVYKLTSTLLAGVLIAISSCFLGFFAYRFNHPAFFVLTYAPWVVMQWDRLGKAMALPNPCLRSCVVQGLLLVLVTWMQLNAGALKEGVILACFIHALGLLSFLIQTFPKWGKPRSLCLAGGIVLSLVMITAPYWLIFLDTLSKSYTNYDTPSITTLPLWGIVGFFENFFFQPATKALIAPSTNLFVLFGLTIALFSLRVQQSRMVYGCWVLFTMTMATAYGLIPVSILISIPFIKNISHIGNTFSVPMMIFALILAGYGIRDYVAAGKELKKINLIFSLVCFLGLWLIYAINENAMQYTILFFVVNFAIFLVGFSQLYRLADPTGWTKRGLIVLTCCFLALHVRHGMHLMTGFNKIDSNVMNPTARPNFSSKSEAVEFVKSNIDETRTPTRVIGEDVVMFPGYNVRLGVEGIVVVDAVRNKHYEKILELFDYPYRGGSWLRLIKSDQIASRAASLDLLGIGYMVAEVGNKMPQDMTLVHSSDLDVWQRKSVWPRAFFVNKVIGIHKPSEILDALTDKAHSPFATVENRPVPQAILNNNAPYQVTPAGGYKLTNNSTHFSVEANGPGIIVLGETYYPGDFIATVNGVNADYIRVNEAFKGIWVNKAGKYEVTFTYRPEKLNLALVACLFGFAILQLLIVITLRSSDKNIKMNIEEI